MSSNVLLRELLIEKIKTSSIVGSENASKSNQSYMRKECKKKQIHDSVKQKFARNRQNHNTLWVPILINSSRAKCLITNVLFHGWLGPTAEWCEIAETLDAVVVGVPQLQVLELRAATSYRAPLGCARINGHCDFLRVTLVDELLNEVYVVLCIGRPIRRPAFDIEPNLADCFSFQTRYGVFDLLSSISAGIAWKQISVHVFYPCGFGVFNRGGSVGIGLAAALINPYNRKRVSIVQNALPIRLGNCCADIDANSCKRCQWVNRKNYE